jgi:hypothetical protein
MSQFHIRMNWCLLLRELFFHKFSIFGHALFFFPFTMVCTHLRYYTSDVHLTIYASYEKKRLKELMHPKMKDLLFFLKINS